MAQMIQRGKELIRINPSNKRNLQVSTTGGRSWLLRYSGTVCGDFLDLMDNGTELLATTSKGLFFSTTEGRSWLRRG